MSKNLVIKLAISLVLICFIYTLFWFFKVGQLEKRIAKFAKKNNAYVTIGNIKTSGFPLAQKVVIHNVNFSIPNPILNKRRYSISQIEALSGIFDNNFAISLPQGISSQNSLGDVSRVEFIKTPNIKLNKTNKDNIVLSYQDQGFTMLDPRKNLVFKTSALKLKINLNSQDPANIKVNIDSNIKEMQGFNIVDLFNNIFEENITKGIQTGKLSLGSSPNNLIEAPENTTQNQQPNVTQDIDNSNLQQVQDSNQQTQETNSTNSQLPNNDTNIEAKDNANSINDNNPDKNNNNVNDQNNNEAQPQLKKEPQIPQISIESLNASIDSQTNQIIDNPNSKDSQNQQPTQASNNVNNQESENPDLQVIVEESQPTPNPVAQDNTAEVAIDNNENSNQQQIAKSNQDISADENLANKELNNDSNPNEVTTNPETKTAQIQPQAEIIQENLENKSRYDQDIIGDLNLSITYILTPNNTDNNNTSFDPTQIQVLPTQYNKEIKINKIEYENAKYKVTSTGSLKLVSDDTSPFGNLLIRIEEHDNFFGYFKDYIKYYLSLKGYNLDEVKPIATEIVSQEITQDSAQNVAPDLNVKDETIPTDQNTQEVNINAENTANENNATIAQNNEPNEAQITSQETPQQTQQEELVIKDPFDNFLKKIYDNLDLVSKQIAFNNPASTDEESRFEIKREKNLEFKINNSRIREILGKF